ncbi:tubulin epsilon and delta complex protein 1-like isoform X2 [Euwallacea fornicatus]|uniref:tubulin epsilon and delta complex protein 1-like isoform X2 n=1 Tax=Euwallacea fornicatus TaxID=995702 RepID=UPI00338F95DF
MDIKHVITILCKLLNTVYKTSLKPEHFRQAKFGKTEENVIPILLDSLYKILNVNNFRDVYNKLNSLNYKRLAFHTECYGSSRELLMALSFLVASSLEKDLIAKMKISQYPKVDVPLFELPVINWKTFGDCDLKNYKVWLCGKISSNNKLAEQYTEHTSMIQEKYNKTLNIKPHGKLTLYEILALKNDKIGQEFLTETEPLLMIIDIYKEWHKNETQFWKWMITVIEEPKKSPVK